MKSEFSLPLNIGITSPAPPAEAIREADSDPVTPVTPLCGDQQLQSEEQFSSVQSTNNNNNNTTPAEEPLVADINNIVERPEDSVELQYTIADVSILDNVDQATSHLTKTENFQEVTSTEADQATRQGKVEMYCVDTSDDKDVTTSLPNGHSSEMPAHDKIKVTNNGDVPTLGKLANEEFDVVIKLDTGEKRFGFSVIGGIDEGFPARVESIGGGNDMSSSHGCHVLLVLL